jgi:hypothetical protein
VQDQLGQLTEALKTLDQAEAAVPDAPHIPYAQAMMKRNRQKDEEKSAVKRTLQLKPDFLSALMMWQRLTE